MRLWWQLWNYTQVLMLLVTRTPEPRDAFLQIEDDCHVLPRFFPIGAPSSNDKLKMYLSQFTAVRLNVKSIHRAARLALHGPFET